MKQRTRMLSGSATADEHRAALVALEARPLPADDPESDLHLLPSTPEERAERRARRRSLMIEALKLRARMKIYPIRLLYIMTLAFSIDAMARSMLGIVLDDVRRDFGVGDFDMSALNAGYAIVAGISVIPFGILSDRWNRKNLIALGFIPWGLAMMWQSVAGTFAMMFIARLFLGSIEGTNGPSTPSILGDYYPVRRRNRVFGIFATGTSLGSTLGFMFGGAMAQGMGWRGSFFAFGVIGLFAALILFRSLEEPDRGLQDALYRLETEIDRLDRIEDLEAEALARPDVAEVILQAHPNNVETRAAPDGGGSEPAEDGGVDYRDLSLVEGALAAVKNRTFALLLAGQVATDFFIGLLGLFAITFFRRYHGLSVASASGVVALLSIAVIIGTVHAGHIGDRLVARGTPGGRVQLTWLTRVVTFFAISLAWATPNLALAAPGFLLTGYLLGIANPLTAAVTVDIVVARLRGQSQGLLAAVRAGSTALGPLALGFLSDRYGLRQGTLFLAPILLVSAVITWLAGRFYDNDQEKARVESLRQYALEEADPRDEISPGESAPEDLASL